MKNKIINTIMLSVTLTIGILIGMNTQNPVKAEMENKILSIECKARGEKFEVENTYTQEDGDIITEYHNGSWSLCNETENKFEFCPAELGDWSYALGNKKELDNIIATYKSIYETGEY